MITVEKHDNWIVYKDGVPVFVCADRAEADEISAHMRLTDWQLRGTRK